MREHSQPLASIALDLNSWGDDILLGFLYLSGTNHCPKNV